jgi:hypothetical protein
MALQVIGPGFGRTATNTLKTALETLGFGPCHHMFEIVEQPGLLAPWDRLVSGKSVDWQDVFADFNSQTDWPGAAYWRDLIVAFPEAKVVVTLRDPDSWYDSFQNTIRGAIDNTGSHETEHMNAVTKMGSIVVKDGVFGGNISDKTHMIDTYNAHLAEIKATVAEDRLLMFSPSEGWAPLCAFLGCPVPDEPFPFTNSRKDFEEKVV